MLGRQSFAALSPILLSFFVAASGLHAAGESELKDDTGKVVIRYVIETPEGSIAPAATKDPARQLGLILCFPEHDRPVGDEILPVREALKRLGLSDQYILLAGGPQARKFGAADHEPIRKLIAWAKQTYPINPRRIYMYGKGEGGKISGEFAMLHPELVTASITYSWGWWTMPPELKEAVDSERSPHFYMVLGLRDLSYHLTTVRDAYSRVNAKGYQVIYREFPELGARTYHPPSNEDAIAWVTKLRNRQLAPSAEEAQLLKRFNTKRVPAPVNGYFPDLALVGGPDAGTIVQTLLESENEQVRRAAAETCAHAVFPEDTFRVLARHTMDASPAVRRTAIRALGIQANWRSAVAQQALVSLATGQEKAVNERDRIDAADGIVQAARLQIRGVQQDPELFRALVGLLKDQNEELRTMAANTLAPIRDESFRGDLNRQERKEPEGGWQAWLTQVSTKAAGYNKDYEVCTSEHSTDAAAAAYCEGGKYLLGRDFRTGKDVRRDPVLAFQNTRKAAEQGYVPAEAALGMMYAVGKGVQQDYPEAAKWWTKAAESGHVLAATNLSMVYRGVPGVRADTAKQEYWAKFVSERSTTAH